MIQLYKDGVLVYDSRLQRDDMRLLTLTGDYGLNKGGVLEFTMDSNHKDYDGFTSYKSIVELWKNGTLEFRGRALYPKDDFYKNRTITCEGEKCFLRDAVMRPYLYQTTPANIFKDLIAIYNSQVEESKQFTVGAIDVTVPSHNVALRSDTAEQVLDAVDKLVELCGGVLQFVDIAGKRGINWIKTVQKATNQTIEFGENLLDYVISDDNPDLLTAVLPYGAEDEETEERLTIELVNNGVDYIQDDDAVALRGFICKPVYFDDITDANTLLLAAQQYLAEKKMVVSTIELTAIDLSNLDKDINAFHEGDYIRVLSKPHGVDGYYVLTERKPDYLHPTADRIVLGKSSVSLTGNNASSGKNLAKNINAAKEIAKDKAVKNANALAESEKTLTNLIQQTADSIMTIVGEEYATNDVLQSAISTTVEQLSNAVTITFDSLRTRVANNEQLIETSSKYIRFEDGNIILGEQGNELQLTITKEKITFTQNGGEVAYLSNNKLFVTNGEFLNQLTLGKFAFLPRNNGNLSFMKVTN